MDNNIYKSDNGTLVKDETEIVSNTFSTAGSSSQTINYNYDLEWVCGATSITSSNGSGNAITNLGGCLGAIITTATTGHVGTSTYSNTITITGIKCAIKNMQKIATTVLTPSRTYKTIDITFDKISKIKGVSYISVDNTFYNGVTNMSIKENVVSFTFYNHRSETATSNVIVCAFE